MDKTSTERQEFLRYRLQADTLCLGERIRGSLFRPCLDVLTYTALVGALKARFPQPFRTIHAVGSFTRDPGDPTVNQGEILSFSPRDRGCEVSVVPLEIEYIANVRAEVFVLHNDFTTTWPHQFTMRLGAMKSKGFGHCRMALDGTVPRSNPRPGILVSRLPEDQSVLDVFSVRKVLSPVCGYLFRPESGGTGHYARSLFEGTSLVADPIILQSQEKAR
jgi:hypothetical protein